MSDDQRFTAELDALLAGALDLRLNDVQMAQFEQMLSESEVVDYYVDHAILHAMLQWEHAHPLDGMADEPSTRSVSATAGEQPSERSLTPNVGIFSTTLQDSFALLSSGWPAAYLIATVIFAMGALIGSFIYVSRPTEFADQRQITDFQSLPPNPSSVVARITSTADCRWEKRGLGMRDWGLEEGSRSKAQGSRFEQFQSRNPEIPKSPNPSLVTNHYPRTTNHLVALGDQFILSAGLMEITYNTGARVILQGPCSYEVDSASGGFLAVGKLTARVEQSAKYGVRSTEKVASESSLTTNHYPLTTTSNPLFAIRTPTATVTDLGTEFGVEVTQEGNTTAHVFRGSVRMELAAHDGKPPDNGQVLQADQSARVEKRGNQRTIAFVSPRGESDFVREMPRPISKTLDLVDVVAGGDGFSGMRGRGINPVSGLPTENTLADPNDRTGYRIDGDGKYHRVEHHPFIDGVFIPESRPDGVIVDSAGHRFSDFLATSNATAANIWAGGPMVVPSSSMPPDIAAMLPSWSPSQTLIPTKLGSVDYAIKPHGHIFMHANNGITFDLDAIRVANPGFSPVRFTAKAGNTEIASEGGLATAYAATAYADIWVLVDGQVRYRCREVNQCTGALHISFPIANSERFLTLMSADGGKNYGFSWILFGDPVLEMAPAAAKR